MAVAPVDVVVGLVLAASSITATSPAASPPPGPMMPVQTRECRPAAWETDAQQLADALAGVSGDEPGARLRQRLEAAGFVPGGEPATGDTRTPDGSDTRTPEGRATESGSGPGTTDLAEFIAALLAALTGASRADDGAITTGPAAEPAPDRRESPRCTAPGSNEDSDGDSGGAGSGGSGDRTGTGSAERPPARETIPGGS